MLPLGEVIFAGGYPPANPKNRPPEIPYKGTSPRHRLGYGFEKKARAEGPIQRDVLEWKMH
jgi:hypothetical protein